MLAIAVSLLFALAGFFALAVLHASLAAGALRVREIRAELARAERSAQVIRVRPVLAMPRPALQPMLAAA
jgi:hypothetical protein